MHGFRIFCQRGRGSKPNREKTALKTFFMFDFLVLNLFNSLQRGSNGFITEKTMLFQGIRGGLTLTFSGGGGGGVGVQMLISIEFDRTCDLPGVRVWTPYLPPLDPHMHDI